MRRKVHSLQSSTDINIPPVRWESRLCTKRRLGDVARERKESAEASVRRCLFRVTRPMRLAHLPWTEKMAGPFRSWYWLSSAAMMNLMDERCRWRKIGRCEIIYEHLVFRKPVLSANLSCDNRCDTTNSLPPRTLHNPKVLQKVTKSSSKVRNLVQPPGGYLNGWSILRRIESNIQGVFCWWNECCELVFQSRSCWDEFGEARAVNVIEATVCEKNVTAIKAFGQEGWYGSRDRGSAEVLSPPFDSPQSNTSTEARIHSRFQ